MSFVIQDGGTYNRLTTVNERVKYHYLPKLCKVCPEIEHEFNDFLVIGSVRPLSGSGTGSVNHRRGPLLHQRNENESEVCFFWQLDMLTGNKNRL